MMIENIESFYESRKQNKGIFELKLRTLLELQEKKNGLVKYTSYLPPIEIGSITLVDQVVLVILISLINPDKILEIGTFKGYTTRLFLENTLSSCKIISIDLPTNVTQNISATNESIARTNGAYNDNYLRLQQAVTGEKYLKNISIQQSNRLKLIKDDSTTIKFKESFDKVDLVFIDGGHDHDTIKKDTENALSVIKSGVIVWHDFSSNLHTDVTSYIDNYAQNNVVYHVKNSLIAFSIINFRI